MRVIAIDPGETTGYCYAELANGRLEYWPFQNVDDVHDLWHRLHKFEPRHIVMEDFEFRRGQHAVGGLNLFPMQMIGIARLYEFEGIKQTALFLQKPAQGKSYYTDVVLKQMKLYKRGVPHGMDAARHLLQWCTFGFGCQFIDVKAEAHEWAAIVDHMEWHR